MQRGKAVPVLSEAPAAGSVTVPRPQRVAPQALPSPRGCGWSQAEKEMSNTRPGTALKTRLEGRAFLLPEQHLSSSGPDTAQAAWKRESKGKLRPGGLSLALHPAFRLFPAACRQGGGGGAGGDEHPAPVPGHPRSPGCSIAGRPAPASRCQAASCLGVELSPSICLVLIRLSVPELRDFP